MQFELSGIYHIYNRGNNKQQIFFSRENYLYFLNKVKRYIYPNCDILAWCLMPNHFHFLVHANENTVELVKQNPIKINRLTERFRLLLSSYTQGINKEHNRTGNLFQQKTKFIHVTEGSNNYSNAAFYYVHQNPCKAGLVSNSEDWEFSSYVDYAGIRNGKLCNIKMATSLFELFQKETFTQKSNQDISRDLIKNIL